MTKFILDAMYYQIFIFNRDNHNLCFIIQDILFVLYQKEKRCGNYKE